MLAGINFHYIRTNFKQKYPSIFGVTPAQFEAQLIELSKHGEFVSQTQLRNAIVNSDPLPENSLLITFDDGLREQYESAVPVLDRLGIPAIFFACSRPQVESRILDVHRIHILRSEKAPQEILDLLIPFMESRGRSKDLTELYKQAESTYRYDQGQNALVKYIINFLINPLDKTEFLDQAFDNLLPGREEVLFKELYMTTEQLCDLASRDYLGVHGHDHSPVGGLSNSDQEYQITESKRLLQNLVKLPLDCFSYPHGTYEASKGMASKLREADYTMAFTMERGINQNLNSPFYIARFDTNDVPLGKSCRFANNDLFQNLPFQSLDYNNS
ncbi:polysaccharide deacetylase family protein [Akkermansiaceae bacterium]|nr:polysaccharide deacetylase family protein [Akkermansiaceae bacterium]